MTFLSLSPGTSQIFARADGLEMVKPDASTVETGCPSATGQIAVMAEMVDLHSARDGAENLHIRNDMGIAIDPLPIARRQYNSLPEPTTLAWSRNVFPITSIRRHGWRHWFDIGEHSWRSLDPKSHPSTAGRPVMRRTPATCPNWVMAILDTAVGHDRQFSQKANAL